MMVCWCGVRASACVCVLFKFTSVDIFYFLEFVLSNLTTR